VGSEAGCVGSARRGGGTHDQPGPGRKLLKSIANEVPEPATNSIAYGSRANRSPHDEADARRLLGRSGGSGAEVHDERG
jgi:hypothetical protein